MDCDENSRARTILWRAGYLWALALYSVALWHFWPKPAQPKPADVPVTWHADKDFPETHEWALRSGLSGMALLTVTDDGTLCYLPSPNVAGTVTPAQICVRAFDPAVLKDGR